MRTPDSRSIVGLARGDALLMDFARGRSAAQLANSFAGYFQPSTQIDDSSDEGYVFKSANRRESAAISAEEETLP